jgi:hypothetical protein
MTRLSDKTKGGPKAALSRRAERLAAHAGCFTASASLAQRLYRKPVCLALLRAVEELEQPINELRRPISLQWLCHAAALRARKCQDPFVPLIH